MGQMEAYLQMQYAACEPAFDAAQCLNGKMTYREWHDGVRELLDMHLAFPKTKIDLMPEKIESVQMDGYRREKYLYTAESGLRTPVYMLIPDCAAEDTPVVLCVHGHGYGCKSIVGLCEEGTYQKNFALEICKRGMIAAAPEMVGFGELRLKEDLESGSGKQNSCQRLSMNLLASGRTLIGVRVYQAIRCLDLIEMLFPERKIGMMGISGGGTVTTLTCAMDTRPQAIVVSGYLNYFKNSILAMRHCVDNYWPGMNREIELPDLFCMLAPRALLCESGTNDPIYPNAAAKTAAEKVQSFYRFMNAEHCFALDTFEGVHEIHGDKAYSFLKEHLD